MKTIINSTLYLSIFTIVIVFYNTTSLGCDFLTLYFGYDMNYDKKNDKLDTYRGGGFEFGWDIKKFQLSFGVGYIKYGDVYYRSSIEHDINNVEKYYICNKMQFNIISFYDFSIYIGTELSLTFYEAEWLYIEEPGEYSDIDITDVEVKYFETRDYAFMLSFNKELSNSRINLIIKQQILNSKIKGHFWDYYENRGFNAEFPKRFSIIIGYTFLFGGGKR